MINAQSLEEIKKYGKDDEIMEEILEYSKIWNEINKEDDITLEDYINEERKRSLIQGEKKEKNNIAKNMLLNKINIDTIIKCTGLTKNEILNLRYKLYRLDDLSEELSKMSLLYLKIIIKI